MNRQEALGGVTTGQLQEVDLRDVIGQMQTEPHTPEIVGNFWFFFIQKSIMGAIGRDPSLEEKLADKAGATPRLKLSRKELAQMEKTERAVYVPDIELYLLEKIFPDMRVKDFLGKHVAVDDQKSSGWFAVEKDTEAPNANTTEEDLKNLFSGKQGMSLRAYIWASKASGALTGRRWDNKSLSRLMGTRIEDGISKGQTLVVSGGNDERLTAMMLIDPLDKGPGLGARYQRPL